RAGRAMVSETHSSSCSSQSSAEVASADSSSSRTPVAQGRASREASSGGTWPVSASTELRPVSTRSKGPRRSRTAARARAVASVSEPAKAGSVITTPWASTPTSRAQASASRPLSSGDGGPGGSHVRRPARAPPPPAVGVQPELEALAPEPAVGPQRHRLERRDLLDQHGDAEGGHAGGGYGLAP